jgi:hypothetical protein
MGQEEIALKQYELHVNAIDKYMTIIVTISTLYLGGTAGIVSFFSTNDGIFTSENILGFLAFIGFLLGIVCLYALPLVVSMGHAIEECTTFLKLKNKLSIDGLSLVLVAAAIAIFITEFLLCYQVFQFCVFLFICVLTIILGCLAFYAGCRAGNIEHGPGDSPFI